MDKSLKQLIQKILGVKIVFNTDLMDEKNQQRLKKKHQIKLVLTINGKFVFNKFALMNLDFLNKNQTN